MGSDSLEISRFLTQWRDSSPFVEAHTSGSTGAPKPVRLPKADMIASAEATCKFFGIGPSSTLFLPLSIDYIAGKMMIVRSEISGASLITERPSNTPLKSDPGCDIDLAAIVPSQVDGLIASPWAGSVKNVIVGGAPLDPRREETLRKAPFRAYATYGMTETCSHVALRDISGGESFYTAMPGISFDTDPRGCLVIVAPAFSFGRIVTNDMVDLVDSRRFLWRGRADSTFISGGVKVHPEEIEKTIGPLLEGVDFRVTWRESEKWGQETVLEIAGDVDTSLLMDNIAAILSPAQRPKAIVRVKAVPRTANGKIIRT